MARKTVLLIRNAAPGDFGGAETYQVSLAQVLKDQGYSPIIVTRSAGLLKYAQQHDVPTVKGWWWAKQNWSGASILLTPLYVGWQLALTVWYLLLIAKTRASVLHIQSKDDFIAGTVAGRLAGKRVIWTDHMDLRYVFMNIARPLRNPVGKLVFWAAKRAHRVILISDNEYTLVTAQFKDTKALRKQIVIVKNGVIDQAAKYQGVQTVGAFTFCLASRVVANKGIGEAIDAFMALEKTLPKAKVRLDIYGGGAELEQFKAQAAASESIVFYGHQADALAKIKEADVFMLPSYQEGFSIALLEATMLGKAIIASNVDSNPELIIDHESGLLVEPRDAPDLERAMRELYTDHQLRNRVAHGARKRYEENFNLVDVVAGKIVPLYEGR